MRKAKVIATPPDKEDSKATNKAWTEDPDGTPKKRLAFSKGLQIGSIQEIPEPCKVPKEAASFLLAVGRQSAELAFGGSPRLGSHGGGMPARSGGSWSTGGEGKLMTPTELLCHNQKQRRPNLGLLTLSMPSSH
jgi:hypothetical protein